MMWFEESSITSTSIKQFLMAGKTCSMWKSLNAEYKAALSHFTMSGTHSSNFFKFCSGWFEIYQVRKHLESKPDLVSTVVADLPQEVLMEKSDKTSSTISLSTKGEPEKEIEIADALRELRTMEVELSKCKLDLIQHQEERSAKNKELLHMEEERNVAEIFSGNRNKHIMQQIISLRGRKKHARLQSISSGNKKRHSRLQNIFSSNRKEHTRTENTASMNGNAFSLI